MAYPVKPKRNADGSKTAPTAARETLVALAHRLFPDLDTYAILAELGRTTHPRNYPSRVVPASPTQMRRWIEMELLRRALRENPRAPVDPRAEFDKALLEMRKAQHAAYTREYRRAQTQARRRAYEATTDPASMERAYLGEVRLKRESAELAADLDGWFASVCDAAHRDEHGDADE